MGYTFAEKALARAAHLQSATAGQIVDAEPDLVLSHDNTAAIARTYRSIGAGSLKHPDRVAVALDHAVPAPTTEHANNHAEARRFVAEYGVSHFFEAGRGVCHQVVSEAGLVWPGHLILGADSHTTHFGWLGAFGAGVGRSEVAAIWATGTLWLRVPETIRVDLAGTLSPWVTAKDLSLWILQRLGPEAGIYSAIEFSGPGLSGLSLESRMVLPNMMAESGAKNAYLPPDEAVFAWLARRTAQRTGRSEGACLAEIRQSALYPDPDARYAGLYQVELGEVEPVVACPHRPDNVVPLSQVKDVAVQQAFLGTCTNGRLEDLAAAAAVLRGSGGQVRRIAPGTRFLVVPASAQVLQGAIAAGYIETLLAAGAMIGTPGCGPCMGNHMGIPAPGEVVISSANRNFRGRMGTPDSSIYLGSPTVVAASAVLGRIADPREVIDGYSPEPREAARDNGAQVHAGAFLQTPTAPAQPGLPPSAPEPAAPAGDGKARRLTGRVWKYGDNVNTDVIFPGKYTYTIKDPEEMARHALEDLDPSFADGVRPGDIIVAGHHWGSGSSREQAAICLQAAGVRVIIAASFGRIFFRNAVNNGLLPVACPAAVAAIEPGETVTVDMERSTIECSAGRYPFPTLSASLLEILEAGGLVPMLRRSNADNLSDPR